MDLRNRMYDRGTLRSYPLGARTVSIGNLTTGGTGKTPLVALTARILAEEGESVCILTRGYGRTDPGRRVLVSDGRTVLANAAEGGDEPVELAGKLLGRAIVIADADRVAAAAWAREKFGVTAFILDDGFQHRRAKRDLDIVCVDATQPRDAVLPAGRLREPFRNIRRADVVVITRADLAENIDDLKSEILDLNDRAVVFRARGEIRNVVELKEFFEQERGAKATTNTDPGWYRLAEKAADSGKIRLGAFCALGNPENFFASLRAAFDERDEEDLELSDVKTFPDHHRYSQKDAETLGKHAHDRGIDALLTTPKDAVKLRNLRIGFPVFVIETEVKLDDEESFRSMIVGS